MACRSAAVSVKNQESSDVEERKKEGEQSNSCSGADHANINNSDQEKPCFIWPENMAQKGGIGPPSFLQQQLLPEMRSAGGLPAPDSSCEKSKGAQMTVFYMGTVHVYDNITIDKARAIMHMADGSSACADPVAKDLEGQNELERVNLESNPLTHCNFQANLPIATSRSLRMFFDKRRDRIMNKYPRGGSTDDKQPEDVN